MFKRHPKIALLILSIIVLIIFLFCLEALCRVARYVVRGPSVEKDLVVSDKRLGWVLNTKMKKHVSVNACGERVVISPYKHKFIVKYPKYQNKKTILFVGDSTTQAGGVSSGQAYYDIFEQLVKDNLSVYAAGVGGYGSLQEYLMLKEIYDDVQPDIVVWQLDANDIQNNVYELENSSLYDIQRRGPYLNLVNDSIEMKNPGVFLFDISYGFRYLFSKVFTLDRKYNLGIIGFLNSLIVLDEETEIRKRMEGFEVLGRVLKLSMGNYPNTRFIGFNMGLDDRFKQIFEKNAAIYFEGFDSKIDGVEDTNCEPLDYHMNHKGHKLAGELMYNYFLEHNLIKK